MVFTTHSSYATTITTQNGNALIRPFGYMAPRPPATARMVDLGDLSIEFSAQQVCGYTDWSSAVIKLPKQLLSTDYWRRIGNNLAKQAVNSVLAISGALPSMLACNASPTFCAILNKAEMLAQANLKFTFDSCQILEGLNDQSKSQFQALRGCVKHRVDHGDDASIAHDKCTIGDNDPSSSKSKDKINNAVKKAVETYKSQTLDKKVCQDVQHSGYSSSDKVYTVAETACSWSKTYFKGISIEAGAKVRHGGTFAISPGERLYEKTIKKTTSFIIDLLNLMHAIRYGIGLFSSEGPQPRHKVVRHPEVLKKIKMRPDGRILGVCYDGENSCHPNVKDLPPIYRKTTTGSLPTLMITPDALFELVELIPATTNPGAAYGNSGLTQVAFALEPLIQSISYSHAQDVNQDSLSRHRDACTDADMQSVAAQEDCQTRISKISQSIDNLEKRYDSDRKHVAAQAMFYRELDKIRASRVKVPDDERSGELDPAKSPADLR